eukprot:3523108-Amphidinium_carterae.1
MSQRAEDRPGLQRCTDRSPTRHPTEQSTVTNQACPRRSQGSTAFPGGELQCSMGLLVQRRS